MRDRFLIGILIGIGVLVAAALILFFARRGNSIYVSDSSPAGALQNYLVALERHEYDRAYDSLAGSPEKPDRTQFQRSFLSYQGQAVANTAIEIGETSLDNESQTAIVQLTLLHGGTGLFEDITREQSTAVLTHINGAWKITEAPYPYWDPSWNLLKQPAGPTPAPAP